LHWNSACDIQKQTAILFFMKTNQPLSQIGSIRPVFCYALIRGTTLRLIVEAASRKPQQLYTGFR
jgi:hypothetical protein